MASLRRSRKVTRRTQPQTTPQISAYWRSRGFKWVVNGTQPRELVSGVTLDPTVGTREVNHSGKALASRSIGVGWTKPISSFATKQVTLVWFGDFYPTTSDNQNLGGIVPNLTDTAPYVSVVLGRCRPFQAGSIDIKFANTVGDDIYVESPNRDYTETKNLGIVGKIKDGNQKLFTNKRGLEVETTQAYNSAYIYDQNPILFVGSSVVFRSADASCSFFAISDQFLTDAECLSLAKNPWQIFNSTPLIINTGASVGTITRPNSDIAVSGWTSSDGAPLYDDIDEVTASDVDYIISPELTSSAIGATFGLTTSLTAGIYDINIRARRTQTTGQIRVVLKDAGGTSVGATNWQTLTNSPVSYVLRVTTTGTATQSTIEAKL